jgi:hypothetical protein
MDLRRRDTDHDTGGSVRHAVCRRERSFHYSAPPFIDLAYKQIEHWISSSDQRSILSAARFPMLACSGVQIDPEDEAGSRSVRTRFSTRLRPMAAGISSSPAALRSTPVMKDLEKLEMQMDMMALNPVTGTHRQYVPQNERDIQETRVHSVVHDLAINVPGRDREGHPFMGHVDRQGLQPMSGGPQHRVRQHEGPPGNEVTQLISLWEKRGISREVLLKEIQNRSVFEEGFDPTKMPADPSLALGTPVPAAPGSTPVKPPPKSQVDLPPPGQNRPGLKQI